MPPWEPLWTALIIFLKFFIRGRAGGGYNNLQNVDKSHVFFSPSFRFLCFFPSRVLPSHSSQFILRYYRLVCEVVSGICHWTAQNSTAGNRQRKRHKCHKRSVHWIMCALNYTEMHCTELHKTAWNCTEKHRSTLYCFTVLKLILLLWRMHISVFSRILLQSALVWAGVQVQEWSLSRSCLASANGSQCSSEWTSQTGPGAGAGVGSRGGIRQGQGRNMPL